MMLSATPEDRDVSKPPTGGGLPPPLTRGTLARVKRLAVLLLVGCGSDRRSTTSRPAASKLDHPATFATSGEFAPAVHGTLAGWNPDGRWFVTGARSAGSRAFTCSAAAGS